MTMDRTLLKTRVGTFVLTSLAALAAASAAQAVPATDVVEAPTGYFLPSGANWYDSPYYRDQYGDWGWTQGAIATSFTTATLNIGAYDVDSCCGEVDNIYAYDNGVAVLLGSLTGVSDDYSYSTFVLGANFFDDIALGLQVWVDIDSTGSGDWLLTLSKSVLSLDEGALPPPTPGGGPVPEPATWAMMLLGFGFVGSVMRRKRSVRTAVA
jgi:hypothetical protein